MVTDLRGCVLISLQMVNQGHTRADLPTGLDLRVSWRTKMFSLGKKVGTKLDERRRIVLEKLRERRAEGTVVLLVTKVAVRCICDVFNVIS
jgi:hypothetical protein